MKTTVDLARLARVLSIWLSLTYVSSEILSATSLNEGKIHPSGRPPVALVFQSPINGTTVDRPDFELSYTLNEARTGRVLTQAEVKALPSDITVCFQLDGSAQPPACTPLISTSVTVKGALPGTWHTIKARLSFTTVTPPVSGSLQPSRVVNANTALEGAGDSVTVFVTFHGISASRMCGKSACLDTTDARTTYFEHIYRNKNWRGRAASGTGSELSATSTVRGALAQVISSYGVTSMLDAPCGDLTWIPYVPGIDKVRYTGADVAKIIVEDNKDKFGLSGRGIREDRDAVVGNLRNPVFVQADLVEAVPSSEDGSPFDLIFVRDLMIHLPSSENFRVLQLLGSSGARLLMASTFLDANENSSADTFVPANGHFINLARPPYCVRPPTALFIDSSSGRPDHRIALWELDPKKALLLGGDCTLAGWKAVPTVIVA